MDLGKTFEDEQFEKSFKFERRKYDKITSAYAKQTINMKNIKQMKKSKFKISLKFKALKLNLK